MITDRALSASEPVAIYVATNFVPLFGATIVCDVIDYATNTVLNTLSLVETPANSGYYKSATDVVPTAAPYNAVLGSVHIYRFRETAPVVQVLSLDGVAYRTLETSAEAVAGIPQMSLTGITNKTTLGGAVAYMRKCATNKVVLQPGAPGNLVLYDDDGLTILESYAVTDSSGAAIAAIQGQPAQRAPAVP